MSAAFRFPHFDWPAFQPALNLWMAVWLVMGSYQRLESVESSSLSNPQAFDRYLESHQLELAEKWLYDASESSKEKWKAAAALRLAHALHELGCLEKSKEILENYWPIIVGSSMESYGWMLKARMESGHDDLLAWRHFCRAEAQIELANWPSEDRKGYAQLSKRLQTQFDQQQQASDRLIRSGMLQEAIHVIDSLIERLEQNQVPQIRLGTIESAQALRSFRLQSAKLWLELKDPQSALASLKDWPGKDFDSPKNHLPLHLLAQEIERISLLATADMQMDRPQEALVLLKEAITLGELDTHLPMLTLEASLKAAQALAMLHQVPQAFELLENAQTLIYQCPKENQMQASALYLEQKCLLLCQMGRVHQAVEEIDHQIDRVAEGQSKARLLLLKARLYEQLGIEDKTDQAYLDLLESSDSVDQSSYAAQYLLKRAKTQKSITQHLAAYLLKPQKNLLNDESMLALSQWAVEHLISSNEELYRVLKSWLLAIQDPLLEPQAKYLLVCLLPQESAFSKTAPSLLTDLLKTTDPHSAIHLLAQGLFITKEPQEASLRMQELLQLAEKAQVQGWDNAYDQLMAWAMKEATQSPDPAIWQQAYEKNEGQFERLLKNDAWSWAYLELSLRLETAHGTTISQKSAQLAAQMEEKPTYWGMSAAFSHAEAMMRLGLYDLAIERISQWLEQRELAEWLQKRASIERVDLAHRANRSELARKWIAKILERWPQLPERPWLELRRYTMEEYENKMEGSQEVLHSIIVNYRQHPSSLCAYYLKALQGQSSNSHSLSDQLRLWEDVERKGQELHKLNALTSDDYVMLAKGTLQRVKGLKAMKLHPQAISTLRTLLSPTGVSCSQASGYYLLEQEARFELADLLFETDKTQEALQQLQLLLHDPYPSSWQAKAHLRLAQFDLDQQAPEACLEKLKATAATTPELQARRLLLGARAWRQLQNKDRAQAHLAQLLKLDDQTNEVRQSQAEGLWDYYLTLIPSDPEQARKILQELSRYKNLPLGQRAHELLQSTSKRP